MFKSEPVPAYLSGKGKVVPFPELSEIDQQWIELEKQQALIHKQFKTIEKEKL